jgi:hypothetical protein
MSGSRTKYYVDSSTFPMFDPGERINQFVAGMLDYSANSPIELSEYMNSYYGGSKLRNLRGYLKWCDTKGFTNTFGRINTSFYGDAVIDNNVITDITKSFIDLKDNDEYKVYKTALNFFSEDFYIKHLATQQGVADLVYQESDINYTIDFPTPNTIRATFKNGKVIEGPLPSYNLSSRFLEISYSIFTTVKTEIEVPPKLDPLGNIIEEGYTYTKTEYLYTYGYIHYQEGSGNPSLDSIIKNNGITAENTFYPVIPIRTDTAWFTGDQANMINETLKFLDIYDPSKGKDKAYSQLQTMLVEGMDGGSINDIDYITLLLGVSINSTNQSDLRYLYEFFFNLHTNHKLSQGLPSTELWTPKSLNLGKNYLGSLADSTVDKFVAADHSDSYYTKYQLLSPASNFNYTYSWGESDYFEANGKFKPNAKVGEYGVLATDELQHRYSYQAHATDDEGNLRYEYIYDQWDNLIERRPVYETKEATCSYTLVCFCKQESENRFRFTLFVDLNLNNLIYKNKSIKTKAALAVKESAVIKQVTHDFGYDFPSAPGEFQRFTFNYVEFEGDPTTAFIVPLERNSFYEVGIRNQLEIAYGSHFLVCNCWIAKKIKWYKTGIFKVIVGVILIVIAVLTWGAASGPAAAVWAAYVGAVAVGIAGAILVLEGLGVNVAKIFSTVFGNSLGSILYKVTTVVLRAVVSICAVISGQWYLIAAVGLITMQDALDAGSSLGRAFFKGVAAAGLAYLGHDLAKYLEGVEIVKQYGELVNVFNALNMSLEAGQVGAGIAASAITSALDTLASTGDFGEAFKQGLISFGTSTLMAIGNSFTSRNLTMADLLDNAMLELSTESYSAMNMKDCILDAIIGVAKNPNTYANLASLTMEEKQIHKLRNLENDYQEFNNKYQSALDTLNELKAQQVSTVTAEFVASMQTNLGRYEMLFPEMLSTLSPEQFLTLATISGSDQLKVSLGSVNNFVDTKLSVEGYIPYPLYYTQTDPTLVLI